MGDPYAILKHLEKKHNLYGLDHYDLDALRYEHERDHRDYQFEHDHTSEEIGYTNEEN